MDIYSFLIILSIILIIIGVSFVIQRKGKKDSFMYRDTIHGIVSDTIQDDKYDLEYCENGICLGSSKTIRSPLKFNDRVKMLLFINTRSRSLGHFVKELGIFNVRSSSPFENVNHESRHIQRNEEFALISEPSFDKKKQNNYIKVSAVDRTNIKGGITSRISPIYGLNYLYSNDDDKAMFWVWENDEIVMKEHYDLSKCDERNLVQVVFQNADERS